MLQGILLRTVGGIQLEDAAGVKSYMKVDPTWSGFLEKVDLPLDLEGLRRFRKEEVISGEEVEIPWTLKPKERHLLYLF